MAGETGDAGRSVLVVTGMSGAGRSTALKALEDMGYEAVDNLPLSLLPAVARPGPPSRAGPLAVGVGVGARGFGAGALADALDALAADPGLAVRALFLDCEPDVLLSRFSETRRRHPAAPDRPVADGIARERRALAPLRARADETIDTTGMTQGDLRRLLAAGHALGRAPGLAVFVTACAYRNGLPREADLVFDVRFLANPHYEEDLRPLSGLDGPVRRFVERDPAFRPFMDGLEALLAPLLPRYGAEGKSYLTIAVGCTGGRHRSVHVAERLRDWLGRRGVRAALAHRDLGPGAGRARRAGSA